MLPRHTVIQYAQVVLLSLDRSGFSWETPNRFGKHKRFEIPLHIPHQDKPLALAVLVFVLVHRSGTHYFDAMFLEQETHPLVLDQIDVRTEAETI